MSSKETAHKYGLQETPIPHLLPSPTFGELLTSSHETHGALDSVDEFKGRRIIAISGGFKKAFMFEEVDGTS